VLLCSDVAVIVAHTVIIILTNMAAKVFAESFREGTVTPFVFQANIRHDIIRVIFHSVKTIIHTGSFSQVHSWILVVSLNT
jgi:hypothetical protein